MSWVEAIGGEGLPQEFINLGSIVYADDPMWIPDDREKLEWSFSDKNTWFESAQAWAFCVPARARLAVFFNPKARIDGRPALFFGCFESVGDADAEARLFHQVERLSRELKVHDVYGPIDFSTFGRYRLRVKAPRGAVTFPGEPYNSPRYPQVLRRRGYAPYMLYYTRELSNRQLKITVSLLRPRLEKLKAFGYRFEPLTRELWTERLRELHGVVDDIFGGNIGYTSLPWEVFSTAVGESFIAPSCPRTSAMAFGPDGDVAGFFVLYPHYGPLVIQGSQAHMTRPSQLRYEIDMPRLQELGDVPLIGKTVGVTKKHRGRGLMSALGVYSTDHMNSDYSRMIGALSRSGNGPLRVLSGCMFVGRRYALYSQRFN